MAGESQERDWEARKEKGETEDWEGEAEGRGRKLPEGKRKEVGEEGSW